MVNGRVSDSLQEPQTVSERVGGASEALEWAGMAELFWGKKKASKNCSTKRLAFPLLAHLTLHCSWRIRAA